MYFKIKLGTASTFPHGSGKISQSSGNGKKKLLVFGAIAVVVLLVIALAVTLSLTLRKNSSSGMYTTMKTQYM